MKTILHIIDTTGPGGAETLFIDLATRLPKDKYRSIALIRGKGWVYEELCRRGLEPILLDAKGSFNFRYLIGLYRIIRHEKVDLIQSHLLGASVYSSLAGILTGTPVVATFHGVVDIGENERLKGLKFALINIGANRIIAVSAGLRDDILGRTRLRADKTQIIYNGIQTSAFQHSRSTSLRQKFGWGEDVVLVGSLGNIRPAKGYNILLQAAALLKESKTSYRFVIAGQPDKQGSLYDELLKLRADLGLDGVVEFLGFLDDPAEYLANLDIFLSSSISEGLPLSAIQAMAASLPLLATRCGGYEELLTDKENGWLVEVGNPDAIAEAIDILASEPETRTRLGEKAREHAVGTFDARAMLDGYEKVYEGLT